MEKKIVGNSYPITYDKLFDFLNYSKNCMCKIKNYGSGFFCKLNIKEFKKITKPFLMTNNHVIDEDFLESENRLYIEINGKEKILDLKNRIKLTDKNNDFTIIEIKDYDKIYNFFEVSPNIMDNDPKKTFKDSDIIIPQFPEGKELSIGFGTILEVNENILHHNVSTEYGSSGSPIISKNNLKLIGIHNKREIDLNENKGIFMKYILNSIKNMKKEKNINLSKKKERFLIWN